MTSVNFSPINDRILVTKGGDSHIHVWDIESGEKVRSMAGLAFAAFSPVLSPDGRTVAIASTRDARDVHLVDVESGALLLEMAGKPPTLDP
jgi:WD40 repeat protein